MRLVSRHRYMGTKFTTHWLKRQGNVAIMLRPSFVLALEWVVLAVICQAARRNHTNIDRLIDQEVGIEMFRAHYVYSQVLSRPLLLWQVIALPPQ